MWSADALQDYPGRTNAYTDQTEGAKTLKTLVPRGGLRKVAAKSLLLKGRGLAPPLFVARSRCTVAAGAVKRRFTAPFAQSTMTGATWIAYKPVTYKVRAG